MREIFFRGKTSDEVGDKKIWIYGDLIQDCEISDIYEIADAQSIDKTRYQVDKETIGEFTELEDISGTRVYTGDIVSVPVRRLGGNHSNWYRKTNKNHGWTGDFIYMKVVHSKDKLKNNAIISGFKFEELPITKKQIEEIEKPRGKERTKQLVDIWNFDHTKIKVIGNIYDNPELIGG